MPLSSRLIASTAVIALCVALAPVRDAAAQVSQGCFVQGQQVSMSLCNPGAGGGGSSMNSAALGAAGSVGYALGGVLGSMLRDALTDPPASDEDAAAAAADQAQAMQRARANQLQQQQQRQADQAAQQHRFQVNQQDLLSQVHALGGDNSGSGAGDVAPVVDLDGTGAAAATLEPRQLDMSANDAGAVDLRDAQTTTVDPRRTKGAGTKAAATVSALQLPSDADMRYLFPDAPSLWPGPKNTGERLLNPLRQREEYLKFLGAEEQAFPDHRAEIEKLRASLDSDAERRKRLAQLGDEVARHYNTSVGAADRDMSKALDKVLNPDIRKYNVADRQALFAKSHEDPSLAQVIRQQTAPIFTTHAKAVEDAKGRAMREMFDAFDKVNPDAALWH